MMPYSSSKKLMFVPNLKGEKDLEEKKGREGRRKKSKEHTDDWEMWVMEHG